MGAKTAEPPCIGWRPGGATFGLSALGVDDGQRGVEAGDRLTAPAIAAAIAVAGLAAMAVGQGAGPLRVRGRNTPEVQSAPNRPAT